MNMLKKGYTQIYTGNGKGKTTAAFGLTLRAAGAGLKSIIIQFMKGQSYSELDAINNLADLITVEQYGSKKFCMPDGQNLEEHQSYVQKGYKRAIKALEEENCQVLVLDEIMTTMHFKLLTNEDILKLIEMKPPHMELVLTGRGATEELIEAADLVTEMKEIKHYYTEGVIARKGIEN